MDHGLFVTSSIDLWIDRAARADRVRAFIEFWFWFWFWFGLVWFGWILFIPELTYFEYTEVDWERQEGKHCEIYRTQGKYCMYLLYTSVRVVYVCVQYRQDV